MKALFIPMEDEAIKDNNFECDCIELFHWRLKGCKYKGIGRLIGVGPVLASQMCKEGEIILKEVNRKNRLDPIIDEPNELARA